MTCINTEVEYKKISQYIYIPKESLLAEKIVQEAHIRRANGGVSLTMAEVRKNY